MSASPTGEPSRSGRGSQFGRYRLIEPLGSGGMAIVYRAIVDGPEGFSRSVVIKRVLPEHARDQEFVRMLIAEARLSARLSHPGIVQVHELGAVENEYYLAMEYVDGCSLRDLVKRCEEIDRQMPIALVCYLVAEVAAALAYAHELTDEAGAPLQIIHRDVSPSNIMITASGNVKLLDFGIAKAADHIRDERTRAGIVKGKVGYLSPEQADGEAVDRRSDLFALGVVMYECLSNRRLFQGSDLSTLKAIRAAAVRPIKELRAVDDDVNAVVKKLLARAPGERFQTGDDVVAELGPIVHRLLGDAGGFARFVREVMPARSAAAGTSTAIRLEDEDVATDETEFEVDGSVARRTVAMSTLPAAAAPPRDEVTGTSIVLGERDLLPERAPARQPVRPERAPARQPVAPARAPVQERVFVQSWTSAANVIAPPAAAPATQPRAPEAPPQRAPSPAPSASTRRAVLLTFAGAFVSGTGIAVALLLWLRAPAPQPAPPAASAAPAIAPPPGGAAAPAPRDVHVRVSGPADAELEIDGVARGRLPADVALPSRSGTRNLIVRQSGHRPFSRTVAADRDASVTATPAPRPAPKPKSKSSAPEIENPFGN
ncbi:MAG TPA: serine/threonine-protein kinase [Polyangia bacterium]|nr:serine/threonine-protein kinase [Polyangia bacterium]